MATPALIIKDDGSFEATPELKEALHLKPGTRLELVESTGSDFKFHVPSYMREIKSWHDLEGILADSPHDPNAELEAERLKELADSER